MGYSTEFHGGIGLAPVLTPAEIKYLRDFNRTRHNERAAGPYAVGVGIDQPGIDYNKVGAGKSGLWCGWTVAPDSPGLIEWDYGEKFYNAAEWMQYLIDHFIGPSPLAAKELPFLTGHKCNGSIEAVGSELNDYWELTVKDSQVYVAPGSIVYGVPILVGGA